MTPSPTARTMCAALRRAADPEKARALQWFFKTGPGEYGEGDRFLGLTVPVLRRFAREFAAAELDETRRLLQSPLHEARLLALLLMVSLYERGDEATQRRVYEAYLAETGRINNWDLVDLSAPAIVGHHLRSRSRRPLYRLARSRSLWERRIAIVATHAFIREGGFDDTLRVAEQLLRDPEDLIHKATGWMLREVGKRDRRTEETFLDRHADVMPRTMLRYAIERFPEDLRQRYLRMGAPRKGSATSS